MASTPVRVASIGMGWWSDVLPDAVRRTPKLQIVSYYTRSEAKREAFGRKDGGNLETAGTRRRWTGTCFCRPGTEWVSPDPARLPTEGLTREGA